MTDNPGLTPASSGPIPNDPTEPLLPPPAPNAPLLNVGSAQVSPVVPKMAPAVISGVQALQDEIASASTSTPQVFPLRTWADWRAFLYFMIPTVGTAFGAVGVTQQHWVLLVVPLLLALLSPVLQMANSANKWRTYIYGVGGAINTLALGAGWWTQNDVAPWVGVAGLIVTSVLANFYTETSTP